jgi:hypothetical protein
MGLISYILHKSIAIALFVLGVYLAFGLTLFYDKYANWIGGAGVICIIASLYFFQTKHNSKKNER